MIGQHLLRFIYGRGAIPKSHYRDITEIINYNVDTLLDLGGGPGLLSRHISANHYIVADIDFELLRHGDNTIDKVCISAEETFMRECSVDEVVVHDALHHFFNVGEAIRNICRYARNCIHIVEYSPTGLGRLLVYMERILGFPGNFQKRDELREKVESECGSKYEIRPLRGVKYYFKIIPRCSSGDASH